MTDSGGHYGNAVKTIHKSYHNNIRPIYVFNNYWIRKHTFIITIVTSFVTDRDKPNDRHH